MEYWIEYEIGKSTIEKFIWLNRKILLVFAEQHKKCS